MKSSRVIALVMFSAIVVSAEKITDEDRLRLIRGLTAEYGTAKISIPRSKKPLELNTTGEIRKPKWDDAMREKGEAAKVGDQIQFTQVTINESDIVFEINGGLKDGRSWRDRIHVGMGSGNRGTMNSLGGGQIANGTNIVLRFEQPLEAELEVAQVKEYLSAIFEFDKHSATESYVENLPPEIQEAIKAQKVIVGMDKEQVILAVGRPKYKSREMQDGVEFEEWVFGQAPGKITFVVFDGIKVSKVKEAYASMGGGDLSPSASEKP